MAHFANHYDLGNDQRRLVIAGGVAANKYLRRRLSVLASDHHFELITPPGKWCTDNAVMIAWAGIERYALGLSDDLSIKARPRWPLDLDAAPIAHNRAQMNKAAPLRQVAPGETL